MKVHDRRIFSLRGDFLYSFEKRPMKIASGSLPWTPLTSDITNELATRHGFDLTFASMCFTSNFLRNMVDEKLMVFEFHCKILGKPYCLVFSTSARRDN